MPHTITNTTTSHLVIPYTDLLRALGDTLKAIEAIRQPTNDPGIQRASYNFYVTTLDDLLRITNQAQLTLDSITPSPKK